VREVLVTDLSPDSLNAWRIYTIKLRLDLLAAERESRTCTHISNVQAARQRAVDDITEICSTTWRPDVDALIPLLIDTATRYDDGH